MYVACSTLCFARFPLDQALRKMHSPASSDLSPEALAVDPARRRLAFDELLASQLALATADFTYFTVYATV